MFTWLAKRLKNAGKAKEDPLIKKDPYANLSPDQKVHAAACNGDIVELERLAAEGVSLTEPREGDGNYPLDSCAWLGHQDAAMALLRLGADPVMNVQAVVGAATWGHAELLEVLLDGGARLDQDLSNETALRWAVQMNNEECAEVLVKKGAWKLETNKDILISRAKGKGMRKLLECIVQVDPDRAADCVINPCSCNIM